MLMRLAGLVLFAAVFLLVPRPGEAQTSAPIPRLGYMVLAPLTEPPSPERAAFVDGLRELGWVDGKTIAIVYRSAKWNPELFDDLAEELVRMKVDVIVTAGGVAAPRAAQKASRTIPVVMAAISDPLVPDLVASLARPGGNVTGVSLMAPELGPKRLELLAEAAPRASRLAVLWNPTFRDAAAELRSMQTGARALGLTLRPVEVKNAQDLARAFALLEKERPDALTMLFDPLASGYRQLVADFAKKHKLPSVFGAREFAEAGGLISYSPNVAAGFRRAAAYVDRILKGARPGDLPVEQPTKFELVINVKTASLIGLAIPPSLLLRADQVIE
jgi:putative tryptophan/tyrosine transport system substrate-binding protein